MADVPMKLLVDLEAGTEKMVPLDAAELAQREVDQAAAVAATAADDQAQADRDALVAKLVAGKATVAETQTALAQLLT